MIYNVYMQFDPIKTDREELSLSHDPENLTKYEVNLIKVGEVEASSGADAIQKAKQISKFKYVSKLARYPIVEKQ